MLRSNSIQFVQPPGSQCLINVKNKCICEYTYVATQSRPTCINSYVVTLLVPGADNSEMNETRCPKTLGQVAETDNVNT